MILKIQSHIAKLLLIRAGSELVKEQELEPGSLENHSGLASTAPSQHLEPDVIQL